MALCIEHHDLEQCLSPPPSPPPKHNRCLLLGSGGGRMKLSLPACPAIRVGLMHAHLPSQLWCCLQKGKGEGGGAAGLGLPSLNWRGAREKGCKVGGGDSDLSAPPAAQARQTLAHSSLSPSSLPTYRQHQRQACIDADQPQLGWQTDPREHKVPMTLHFGVPSSDLSLDKG